MEVIVDMPVEKKTTCHICFDDDLKTEQMFSVALCGHQFCVKCVKRYIEVGLLEGSALRCPYYQCESKLSLSNCADFLTPKLISMWEQRNEEESIHITKRIYCPNPKCSVLMSKTELGNGEELDGVISNKRSCVNCGEPFCIECKVPWHNDLSCNDYKSLGPNPTVNDVKFKGLANKRKWRQCGKCQHMIELSEGCIKLTCRCGYSFCYKCGAEWKGVACPHQEGAACCCILLLALIVFIIAIAVCFG